MINLPNKHSRIFMQIAKEVINLLRSGSLQINPTETLSCCPGSLIYSVCNLYSWRNTLTDHRMKGQLQNMIKLYYNCLTIKIYVCKCIFKCYMESISVVSTHTDEVLMLLLMRTYVITGSNMWWRIFCLRPCYGERREFRLGSFVCLFMDISPFLLISFSSTQNTI